MARKFGMDWNRIEEKMKEAENTSSFKKDERFFELPIVDRKFEVKLRLMIPPEGEDLPKVRYDNHWFRGRNGIYNERCNKNDRSEKCPACDHIFKIYKENEKEIANEIVKSNDFWPKENYIVNVYVEESPYRPEQEGKVFLWRIGRFLNGLIMKTITPTDKDEKAIPVFDFYDGAILKVKGIAREFNNKIVPQYTGQDANVKFLEQSAFMDGDEDKMEEVVKQLYPLKPFISDDNYKEYSKLKTHFNKVMGFENEDTIQETEEEKIKKQDCQQSTKKEDSAGIDFAAVQEASAETKNVEQKVTEVDESEDDFLKMIEQEMDD